MKKIDVSKWKEFSIKSLFTIKKGERLTKADMRDGDIRFIGASAINNGITAYISNDDGVNVHPGNTITVAYHGSVGESFYQDERFWASDDVNVLYPKFAMNKEIAFFIIPVLRAVGQNYQFIDKWKLDVMEDTLIKLPSSHGKPDFKYMETYIKALEKRVSKSVDALGALM